MAAKARGFQWGGSGHDIVAGAVFGASGEPRARGATFTGTSVEPPPTRGIRQRGLAFTAGGDTGVPGAQFGPTTADKWGGTWNGYPDASVADLLDTEGFALVLEKRSGSDRLAFSPDEPTYRDIKTVGWTSEVNKMASWEATIPETAEPFSWPFADVVVGYDGARKFHGVLLEVTPGGVRDGELTLSGYGPLFWAGHDHIDVHYSDMGAWRAIEDLWLRVAEETQGQVRGQVIRPRPEHINAHWIPKTGVSWSGTPAEVLQQAHGYAGMAFAFDYTEQASVAQSFVPGEELRRIDWQTKAGGVNPAISTEGYHNQITVEGARKPGIGESTIENPDRYSATATAPQAELDSVMDGEIHSRTVRDEELTSKAACKARAETILAEDRGEYTIGGSLETPPTRDVVPGNTYRVSEFDDYAPEVFSPVWASLRAISQSYGPGEAIVSLHFDDESRLVEHIRADIAPDTAPVSVKRRDAQLNRADPNYTPPPEYVYAAGAGVAGMGPAGAGMGESDGEQL